MLITADVVFLKQKYINNKLSLAIQLIFVGYDLCEGVEPQGLWVIVKLLKLTLI
jgi:hypothetical protein